MKLSIRTHQQVIFDLDPSLPRPNRTVQFLRPSCARDPPMSAVWLCGASSANAGNLCLAGYKSYKRLYMAIILCYVMPSAHCYPLDFFDFKLTHYHSDLIGPRGQGWRGDFWRCSGDCVVQKTTTTKMHIQTWICFFYCNNINICLHVRDWNSAVDGNNFTICPSTVQFLLFCFSKVVLWSVVIM